MSDPDAEIADSAKSQWMDALQELEDDGEIAGVVESALKSLRDKEMIEEVYEVDCDITDDRGTPHVVLQEVLGREEYRTAI